MASISASRAYLDAAGGVDLVDGQLRASGQRFPIGAELRERPVMCDLDGGLAIAVVVTAQSAVANSPSCFTS